MVLPILTPAVIPSPGLPRGSRTEWVDDQSPGQVQLCRSTRLKLQRGHAEGLRCIRKNCLWSLGV